MGKRHNLLKLEALEPRLLLSGDASAVAAELADDFGGVDVRLVGVHLPFAVAAVTVIEDELPFGAVVDTVSHWALAREQGPVRGERGRVGGDRFLDRHAAGRQLTQEGRGVALVAAESSAVGTQGVEYDEEEVGEIASVSDSRSYGVVTVPSCSSRLRERASSSEWNAARSASCAPS